MKSILCYGDSITWGTDPTRPGLRHAPEDRWPNVLAKGLGADIEAINEGLGGRTTAFDDSLADCDRNGVRILPTIMHTHRPVDVVILSLGTNDLKPAIAGNAPSTMLGMRRLVEIVKNFAPRMPGYVVPDVVIVSPPYLAPSDDPFFDELFAGGIAESRKLAPLYRKLAAEMGCAFFDAAEVAKASSIDGIHLDAANTRAMGEALVPIVRALLHKR
jgi:lysophospholipase L1-like esterase